ncbi:MAG: heme lyase CcmF/NrfE family subunit [Candidatus Macondimonas sp.]
MIIEWGHFALVLAFLLALCQTVFPLWGAARNRPAWMAVAVPAAWGQLLFLALSYGVLTYAFVSHDFSVLYVAQNSNSTLPLIYRLTGVWGGHEGSILLWVLILAGWTVAVAASARQLPTAYAARVIGVMGAISVGFLAFILFTSNPFTRQFPVPVDGQDLNPLLQDPGMVIHPPMLYMGYVGFSVAFALAVAALLGGRLDATWARWSRPWTTAAWMFLTVGIALGSHWAYYELGWGGWWFWDPVENASFMPWLTGTALIHSLAVTEKRDGFKAWSVLLALTTFSLSLLGTFLVRSGVLTSVHAFATDPGRGLFILTFLTLVVGGSLMLYAWRAPRVRSLITFAPLSRESLLLANNVLLVVAAAAVLLGTLYPLAVDALGLGKLSVGPPYFNTVFVPLMLPLIVLMGLGPLVAWRQGRGGELARVALRIGLPALGLALLCLVVFGLGWRRYLLAVSLWLAFWTLGLSLYGIGQRLGRRGFSPRAWAQLPRGFYGMHLAHAGIALFMIGAGVVSALEAERVVRLAPGESTELAGYAFRLESVYPVTGPNYTAEEALIVVSRAGREVARLTPQKRLYTVRRQAMTQTAFDAGLTRDLFAALGEPLPGGAWSVRVHYKPMVRWIWMGTALMALGGLLAITDRRYRLATARVRSTPMQGAVGA